MNEVEKEKQINTYTNLKRKKNTKILRTRKYSLIHWNKRREKNSCSSQTIFFLNKGTPLYMMALTNLLSFHLPTYFIIICISRSN